MITITICIGSSCHLKGSYDVVKELQALVKKHDLENSVSIKASFCLGECVKAVSVKVDDGQVVSVSKENVTEFFNEHIIRTL